MKTNTRRIGSTDYEIRELLCTSIVRFDIIPRYDEPKVLGKEYPSIEAGINAIQREHLAKYKRYVFTMEEALEKYEAQEFAWNLRVHESLFSKNGEAKKTGFIVIIAEKDTHLSDSQCFGKVKYCRSVKARDESQIDIEMLMEVVDTSNYTPSQMFHLNHGMSAERYMST